MFHEFMILKIPLKVQKKKRFERICGSGDEFQASINPSIS